MRETHSTKLKFKGNTFSYFSDSKSKKSVAYNYACILVLLVVQSSSDVQMLEQHSAPLLKLCKADENNAKLQGTVCAITRAVVPTVQKKLFQCL